MVAVRVTVRSCLKFALIRTHDIGTVAKPWPVQSCLKKETPLSCSSAGGSLMSVRYNLLRKDWYKNDRWSASRCSVGSPRRKSPAISVNVLSVFQFAKYSKSVRLLFEMCGPGGHCLVGLQFLLTLTEDLLSSEALKRCGWVTSLHPQTHHLTVGGTSTGVNRLRAAWHTAFVPGECNATFPTSSLLPRSCRTSYIELFNERFCLDASMAVNIGHSSFHWCSLQGIRIFIYYV